MPRGRPFSALVGLIVGAVILAIAVLPTTQPAKGACEPVTLPAGSLTTPFDSSWQAINAARVEADVLQSPNCKPDAILITEDATPSAIHAIARDNGASTATPYTYILYAKRAAGERNVEPQVFDATNGSGVYMKVNLERCLVTLDASVFGSYRTPSGFATPVGDGWCKISMTYTPIVSPQHRTFVYLMIGEEDKYTGDGKSGIYVWGAELKLAR